jgi:hypothetical protein
MKDTFGCNELDIEVHQLHLVVWKLYDIRNYLQVHGKIDANFELATFWIGNLLMISCCFWEGMPLVGTTKSNQ